MEVDEGLSQMETGVMSYFYFVSARNGRLYEMFPGVYSLEIYQYYLFWYNIG